MGDSYGDLRVWEGALELVGAVFETTRGFPKEKRDSLVSQMRRAAVSIASNIAEAEGRITDRNRSHFYFQARGSLLELETQILIAQGLEFLTESRAQALLERSAELGRMLNSLILSIDPAENAKSSAVQVTSIRPVPPSAR